MSESAKSPYKCHPLRCRVVSIFLGVALVILVMSCNDDITELPGEPPISEIVLIGRSVRVSLLEGVGLESVFDKTLFAEIEPGMSVERAREILGQDPKESKFLQSPAFYFRSPRGPIAIVKRMVSSQGDDTIKWELYAFPWAPEIQEVLGAEVLRQIPSLSEIEEILMASASGREAMSLRLKNSGVQWVYWGR